MRLFFVTDIHGSDLCFRKFLSAVGGRKRADVLVIGGDLLGKVLVPIVRHRSGTYEAKSRGKDYQLETESEVADFERSLSDGGSYGYRCDEDEAAEIWSDPEVAEKLLEKARVHRIEQWVDLVSQRLRQSAAMVIINPGNDDPFYIDGVLRQSSRIIVPEGVTVELPDGLSMISTGYTNRTPWNCPRDVEESELAARIEGMACRITDLRRCLFNFHAPPFGTGLDLAPEIDADLRPVISLGGGGAPVGSLAVLNAIRKYQPLVGLHGHVHEAHAFTWIEKTICFNPGSDYENGNLQGVFLEVLPGPKLGLYGLTREHG